MQTSFVSPVTCHSDPTSIELARYPVIRGPVPKAGVVASSALNSLIEGGVAPLRTIKSPVFYDPEAALLLNNQGWDVRISPPYQGELPVGKCYVQTPWGREIAQKFGTFPTNTFGISPPVRFLTTLDWRRFRFEHIRHELTTGKIEKSTDELIFHYTRVQGVEGMNRAHWVMKKYRTVGMLIGSMAKEIWRKTEEPLDPFKLATHRDVDVMVLSYDCKNHPGCYEGGIDWFFSHSFDERPRDGSGKFGVGAIILLIKKKLKPGLYLCPPDLVEQWNEHERRTGSQKKIFPVNEVPRLEGFPILPRHYFAVHWCNPKDPIAGSCRRESEVNA